MALPFFDSGSRKRPDQILAVDLGSRTTKAVHVQRRGEGFALCRYALLDAPIFEKTLSPDLLSEHLRVVSQALDTKTKLVALAMGVNVMRPRMTEGRFELEWLIPAGAAATRPADSRPRPGLGAVLGVSLPSLT